MLVALLGLLTMVAAPAPPAHATTPAPAESPTPSKGAAPPVRLVLTTTGLTWEDIDAGATPTLQCLADRSGLGAMNTTSAAPPQTLADGIESLHTGYRGGAAHAPASAGIPKPPRDQWAQLAAPSARVDLAAPDASTRIADALQRGAIVEADASEVPATGDRTAALRALDAQVADALAPLGGCRADALPRTLFASVAAPEPASGPAPAPALQVVMDTAHPGEVLTSGATKQDGILVLTDVLPTILASHDAQPEGRIPGQEITAVPTPDAQLHVRDRTAATRLVDAAQVPALLSWMGLGFVGMALLLAPPLARRPALARLGRALATIGPLALPVGLLAQALPWWRAQHPALALTAWVWAGSAALSALVLLGPWRRHRLGPPGASAALVAGIVLAESALGSHLQVGSPLGAQPVTGGRFYGLSNHLFGLVLAGSLMALLCLFARVRSPRGRVVWSLGVGAVVAGVCVAPTMGADFGSMLVTVPTFGLLALLVSGVRPRLWHVLALGLGGAAAVLGVSFLDWLRPPAQRTHLGRFIDDLLNGDLLGVVTRKAAQNLDMTLGIPGLALVLLLAALASAAMLLPQRLRWRRLTALDAEVDAARAVRIALVAGTWFGYAVNDTGPVLVAAVLAVWMMLLPAALPEPAPGSARQPAPALGPAPGPTSRPTPTQA